MQKPHYDRGVLDGIAFAVTFLHRRAKEMNDPHAKQVLNSAGFALGSEKKELKDAFTALADYCQGGGSTLEDVKRSLGLTE